MDYTKLYINGEWIESNSKEFIEVENPANREIIGKVPRANKADVDYAVRSAREAFETWQYTDLSTRISLVERLIEELYKRADELAAMIVKELGRGMDFALNMHTLPFIKDGENYVRIVKEYEFEKDMGDHLLRMEPVGVVAALTPWNYPLGQVTKKVIPALLTGNTIILKPSQNTPLVTYILADAIDKLGFPKGVFNLVTGTGAEVGNMLVEHEDVDMVTFTGSTKTGREVAQRTMKTIKRLTLELGGKSPSVILKGADLELALKKTLDTVYNNTGQTCSALTRLLVPEDEKEKIEEMVIRITKEYPFGDPALSPKNIGPVVSERQFLKVKSYIEKGIEEGARLIYGEVPQDYEKGYYIKPVVFSDVKNDMTIAREEIFGPVLCIIPYKDKEEAIRIANDTEYGLSSAVFGPEDEAREVANRIKAGNVIVNKGLFTRNAPFGGFKQSGLGREGGIFGVEEFLEPKAIFVYNK
ncbi:MAG: aldehyde dehydrogenase family protein [Tissierellia bacterium]|nr:aldehyde dehydrogenase family protein [Tissierellia bacterium]